MNKKHNRLATPTEQRQEQEQQTNEALLAEDAVQTTSYTGHLQSARSVKRLKVNPRALQSM